MQPTAEPFATTAGGYLTGIGFPMLCIAIGYGWKRLIGRLDRQDEALTQHSRGLAVLVTEHLATARLGKDVATRVSDIDRTTYTLRDRLDRHEKWSEEQDRRLQGQIEANRERIERLQVRAKGDS